MVVFLPYQIHWIAEHNIGQRPGNEPGRPLAATINREM
jgi:hypothetical protein